MVFVAIATITNSKSTNAAAAAIDTAEIKQQQHQRRRRPNFIVIQPDDHYFFEEWNPPGRFQNNIGLEDIFDYIGTDDDDDYYDDDDDTTSSSSSSKKKRPSTSNGLVPNINRIRDGGLEMKNAYAASTMCGTSRYSTITGRLPSRSSYGRKRDKEAEKEAITVNYNSTHLQQLFVRDVIIPKTKLEDVRGVADPKDCSRNNNAAML